MRTLEPQTYEELAPIQRSRSENYLTINESIDPNDWAAGVSADSIVQRVIKQVKMAMQVLFYCTMQVEKPGRLLLMRFPE